MTDRRTLGPSGLSVSPLCLGADVFSWGADEKATFDVLVTAARTAVDEDVRAWETLSRTTDFPDGAQL
ncbi:hypothetical protein GCM10023082_46280 [Streptomyces tremellae]|uniref:Uncharacterized protein n=1 Tax=Streptomyces tremellae TaxID=1124239 RepID=A0ABP7FR27_9ACTN